MRRPSHRYIFLGGNKLTRDAIKHVEKTVFGCLHDDFSELTANFQLGKNHVLGRSVVPSITGGGLVVPNIVTSIRVKGYNRR